MDLYYLLLTAHTTLSMLMSLSVAITAVGAILFFSRRLLCYLRHFQQVDYSKEQFKDWIFGNGIYDKKCSLISAIAALTIELTRENIVISLVVPIWLILSNSLWKRT